MTEDPKMIDVLGRWRLHHMPENPEAAEKAGGRSQTSLAPINTTTTT